MILITICGRGGSRGVPDKNIRIIDGRPLIWYTIDIAREFSSLFPSVIGLSTDSNEIRKVAAERGLVTGYDRPAGLAVDSAGKIAAIGDLLLFEENRRNKRFEYILDLDITSPIRSLDDLKKAFQIIKGSDQALNLFSVSPARRNPYFNMTEEKEDGFVGLVKTLPDNILCRQDAPEVYDMNGSFYYYKREFFDAGFDSAITHRSLKYLMPGFCMDIDDEIDFRVVEFLIENRIVKTI